MPDAHGQNRTAPERRRILAAGPFAAAVIAACVALVFVTLRLGIAADGDISRFVVAGTAFTDPDNVDPSIYVVDGDGYDGQFYWRMAVSPAELELSAVRGVELDVEMRLSRIAYPWLAFAASTTRAELVEWSMPFVNVIAVGLLAGVSAGFAIRRGLPYTTGLLVAAPSGLVMSLARDLCEVVMVLGVVGGVVAVLERRYGWAAAAWTLAVLAHEQSVVVIATYGLTQIWASLRRGRPWSRADLPWFVPGVAFTTVQIVVGTSVGGLPIFSSTEGSVTAPLGGLLPEMGNWMTGSLGKLGLIVFPQLALVVATVVVACKSGLRLPVDERWIVWALGASTLMALSLSRHVWVGPAELRQVVIVPTMAWLVVIAARRIPPSWLVVATAGVWLATAASRIVYV